MCGRTPPIDAAFVVVYYICNKERAKFVTHYNGRINLIITVPTGLPNIRGGQMRKNVALVRILFVGVITIAYSSGVSSAQIPSAQSTSTIRQQEPQKPPLCWNTKKLYKNNLEILKRF